MKISTCVMLLIVVIVIASMFHECDATSVDNRLDMMGISYIIYDNKLAVIEQGDETIADSTIDEIMEEFEHDIDTITIYRHTPTQRAVDQ